MGPRSILDSLREFAKRELRDKSADRVCVRRVKMKSVMRRGQLPDLRIWTVRGTHYLVCVFCGDSLRVYYMDKLGRMLGADEFTGEKMEKIWAGVSKGTRGVLALSGTSPPAPSATSS